MKLIEQLIKKKMDLQQEGFLNKNYMRGLWNFYTAYSISIAYLGETDPDIRIKNHLWRKFILNPDKADSKKFKRLLNYMNHDLAKINQAMLRISEETASTGNFGDVYKPMTLGVFGFEYPTE